jgi:hypothetical protein
VEGKIGKMWEGGRERDGIELVEYCDNRFFDACDIGRGRVDLRLGFGGDVIRGGSGGWLGFAPGEAIAGGEAAGEVVGDMIAVIFLG